MKQFRNFTAEQKHINEIGPVGATIAGVMGLIGGYKAVKAGLKKFKGYRENRADKKARREQGFDMKVKPLGSPILLKPIGIVNAGYSATAA